MSCTVVGAQGFIGERLARLLSAEGESPWTPTKGEPELLERDLGVLWYCAGSGADYDQRPFDTVDSHTCLISEIIRAGNFERLIYCSSTRLYDGLSQIYVDESTPLVFNSADPRRVFDLSKALGENLTLARSEGRGVVARLSNVFNGHGDSPDFLSEWLKKATSSRTIILDSSPSIQRDYIHLDDAVASLRAIASGSGIYNVACGKLISNGEIAEIFKSEGWSVTFTGVAEMKSPPNVSVERLSALGIKAKSVKDVIREFLRELKF